jgi:hypothetical protein
VNPEIIFAHDRYSGLHGRISALQLARGSVNALSLAAPKRQGAKANCIVTVKFFIDLK